MEEKDLIERLAKDKEICKEIIKLKDEVTSLSLKSLLYVGGTGASVFLGLTLSRACYAWDMKTLSSVVAYGTLAAVIGGGIQSIRYILKANKVDSRISNLEREIEK